jgi:hypothetical protein
MEVRKVLDMAASTVTTLPRGTDRLKATWFTEAVTVMRRLCRRAAILAARSMRASNSPPKRLFRGLVSLGKTRSVIMVLESLGVLGFIRAFWRKDRPSGNKKFTRAKGN